MLVTQSMCGSCFFSTARRAVLHRLLVFGRLDVVLAHVADGAGEKAAGAAGGIEQDFAGLRVDAVDHEGGDGARRVVFAGIARRLQVVEDLLVDVAEVLALGQIVEIDLVDLVDDLPQQAGRTSCSCRRPRTRRAPHGGGRRALAGWQGPSAPGTVRR